MEAGGDGLARVQILGDLFSNNLRPESEHAWRCEGMGLPGLAAAPSPAAPPTAAAPSPAAAPPTAAAPSPAAALPTAAATVTPPVPPPPERQGSDTYDKRTHDRLNRAAFDWCEGEATPRTGAGKGR